MAPAETALRDAGGLESIPSVANADTESVEMCNGRRSAARSRGSSGDTLGTSGAGAFLAKDERLNKVCGLSRDDAREWLPGGGGNT